MKRHFQFTTCRMKKQPTPSDLLRQQVIESGLKHREIASQAKISPSRFAYIFSRGASPTLDEAERIRLAVSSLLAKEVQRIESLRQKYGLAG